MKLGKLPVPGCPTNLDRTRAYCACNRCGLGLFGHFFLLSIVSLFFLFYSGRRPNIDKYCLKGLLNPKQPTNLFVFCFSFCYLNLRDKFDLSNILFIIRYIHAYIQTIQLTIGSDSKHSAYMKVIS